MKNNVIQHKTWHNLKKAKKAKKRDFERANFGSSIDE